MAPFIQRTLRVPRCKLCACCVVLLLFAAATTVCAQRYLRDIRVANTPHPAPNSCLVLDSAVYTHAASTLADLRILDPARREIPYALTLSGPSSSESTPATILKQILLTPTHLTFDLATPPRLYSALDLSFNTLNFIATAKLTGLRTLTDPHPTYLGTFTLFDLTAQQLGQNTHLEFAESTFPALHLDLQLTLIPGANPTTKPRYPEQSEGPLYFGPTAASFPPSRQSQTLYSPIATAQTFTQTPTQTIATFQVPAHVPVERVTFTLDPTETANFSRTVNLTAQSSTPNTPPETIIGSISRVHTALLGHKIASESLSIPAILGSNARDAATITISIQNDASPPLKLRAVSLEMRQRKLCFPTVAKAELLYGYRKFTPVTYPFATTFNASAATQTVTLGPENLTLIDDVVDPPRSQDRPLRFTLALLATLLAASALFVRLFKRRSRA